MEVIHLVIVYSKPQPDRSLSPRIVIPEVLPAEPEDEFPELREEPKPEPAYR